MTSDNEQNQLPSPNQSKEPKRRPGRPKLSPNTKVQRKLESTKRAQDKQKEKRRESLKQQAVELPFKRRRLNWSDDAVVGLLRLRMDTLKNRFTMVNQLPDQISAEWDKLALQLMSELSATDATCPQISGSQCQDKFDRLKKEFRDVSARLKNTTGNVPVEQPTYWDDLISFLSTSNGLNVNGTDFLDLEVTDHDDDSDNGLDVEPDVSVGASVTERSDSQSAIDELMTTIRKQRSKDSSSSDKKAIKKSDVGDMFLTASKTLSEAIIQSSLNLQQKQPVQQSAQSQEMVQGLKDVLGGFAQDMKQYMSKTDSKIDDLAKIIKNQQEK